MGCHKIKNSAKTALMEKNVVQLKKGTDGTIQKFPVDSEAKIVKLAAQLGTVDLPSLYGVPK